MDDQILKGNFKVENEVVIDKSSENENEKNISGELRKRVLATLGGSMVYVERKKLLWNGDDKL